MQISKRKAQIIFGTLLLLFFVFTVDFRVSIFRSVYIAYAVALLAIFLIFRGANVRTTWKGSNFSCTMDGINYMGANNWKCQLYN